ncbi:MAG: hypothetical protein DWI68_04820 [Chloroflexi bacterium]|nr:MAG: hypothetical protein DWI68_04820 [Chloroflexota bacterium]
MARATSTVPRKRRLYQPISGLGRCFLAARLRPQPQIAAPAGARHSSAAALAPGGVTLEAKRSRPPVARAAGND